MLFSVAANFPDLPTWPQIVCGVAACISAGALARDQLAGNIMKNLASKKI
ncbi:hypothetical protein [Sphaerisporangium sp. NPDC051011]